MVFTKEEEDILRLIINELRTRKKLDSKRKEKDTEFRAALNPLQANINDSHKVEFDLLQSDYNKAEKDIEEMF